MLQSRRKYALFLTFISLFEYSRSYDLDVGSESMLLSHSLASQKRYMHKVSDLISIPNHLEARTPVPEPQPEDTGDASNTPAELSPASSPTAAIAANDETAFAPGVSLVAVLEMGSQPYTIGVAPNGNLLFGSATITANAAAATVDGQTISFGVSGLIINSASTFPVSAAPTAGNINAAVVESAAPTTGPLGEALATPPPDSSFQQYKGNSSVARSGSQSGKGSSGMDSGAVEAVAVGKSGFAFLVGIFVMLLI